ncbi:hypothetical protein As57867_017076, partial [Aphanomyces stellatus]
VYRILHNQPRVKAVSLAVDTHFCGVPILPTVDLDFCTPAECTWVWRRGDDATAVVVGTDRMYTPTAADAGHALTVTCTPPRSADASDDDDVIAVTTTTEPVRAGPDRSVFGPRQALGRLPVASSTHGLRLMTYNILYAKYARADREFNRMYPYAAPGVLQEGYRMPLVVLEVLETGADIVCFQEMGEGICGAYFEPLLAAHGFVGHYAGKGGSTPEGTAVFARTEKFELLETHVVKFATYLTQHMKTASPLTGFLRHYPHVVAAVAGVPSIAQVVALRSKHDGSVVLVANTHLFYRADANIVRFVQTMLFAEIIHDLKRKLEATNHVVRLVVGGDLNARPCTSPIELLLRGCVTPAHKDWVEAPLFRWAEDYIVPSINDDDHVDTTPLNLGQPLRLHNAIETEFTTYLRNLEFTFQDTLDYILIDPETLRVVQTFPLFSHAQVDQEQSLPSTVFPSDHISLVCDVEFAS